MGMQIVPLGVHAPDDLDAAFAAMSEKPPDAILMLTDILTVLNRKRVIDFAVTHRLPAIYEYAFLAHDGGLMAYGPNMDAIFDRAAGLVDQILKGASPPTRPSNCRPASISRSTWRPRRQQPRRLWRLGLPGNR